MGVRFQFGPRHGQGRRSVRRAGGDRNHQVAATALDHPAVIGPSLPAMEIVHSRQAEIGRSPQVVEIDRNHRVAATVRNRRAVAIGLSHREETVRCLRITATGLGKTPDPRRARIPSKGITATMAIELSLVLT